MNKNSLIPICITLGTRPEAIKLAPVIQQFQKCPHFEFFESFQVFVDVGLAEFAFDFD
ncbi:UDP-N-acetylglucosamine 2-epimerase [Arthrospira platensis NIES-46]|uniref:UDP-N-acetylglucosamine 2-epimerase n=1 Tax=Limnospira platensis NIES-46 TaxID=1236695 RepID=A0A5M3TEA5_LIMPL|nr:UDP-N-acetylglucosamine 2-epimerase [Arthrospira platensis NIES-46]